VTQVHEFHRRVLARIRELGGKEGHSDADYLATALFDVADRHRPEPEPDVPEGKTLFLGWRPSCVGCYETLAPCPTLLDVATAIGVEHISSL